MALESIKLKFHWKIKIVIIVIPFRSLSFDDPSIYLPYHQRSHDRYRLYILYLVELVTKLHTRYIPRDFRFPFGSWHNINNNYKHLVGCMLRTSNGVHQHHKRSPTWEHRVGIPWECRWIAWLILSQRTECRSTSKLEFAPDPWTAYKSLPAALARSHCPK